MTKFKVYWSEITEEGPAIKSLEISEAIARMKHNAALKGFFYPNDKQKIRGLT